MNSDPTTVYDYAIVPNDSRLDGIDWSKHIFKDLDTNELFSAYTCVVENKLSEWLTCDSYYKVLRKGRIIKIGGNLKMKNL